MSNIIKTEGNGIEISGHGVEVNPGLRSYIEEEVNRHIFPYMWGKEESLRMHIVLSTIKHVIFEVKITLHALFSRVLHHSSTDRDLHSAINNCISEISSKLKRDKDKLNDHFKDERPSIKKRVALYKKSEEDKEVVGSNLALDSTIEDYMLQEDNEELERSVEKLTLNEAFMRMRLAGTDHFLFHNQETGNLNMLVQENRAKGEFIECIDLGQA